MQKWHWTVLSGVSLILPAYCGLVLTGTPSLLSPFPTLTVLVAFAFSGAFPWLAVVVPTVLFCAWNPTLVFAEARLPTRSLVLLVIFTLLTIIDFLVEFRDGLRYQGATFTFGTFAVNVGCLIVLWIVFVRGWRKPSFFNNLLAHWLLFVWLGWYAFPYLGELP